MPEDTAGQDALDALLFEFDLTPQTLGAEWVRVTRGGLPQPLDIKFRLRGRRAVIVAVRIDGGAEVTSAHLRNVRLGEMAKQLMVHIHTQSKLLSVDSWGALARLELLEHVESGSVDGAAVREVRSGALRELELARERAMLLDAWLGDLEDVEPDAEEVLRRRRRGATPPTAEEYRAFARVFLEELTQQPRGARSRTARRLSMDRGTVYRWIAACQSQDVGLLPTDLEGSES